LWYQGESNTGRSHEYEALLSSMIIDWRSKLNNSTLPFFIIQLPNFMQTHTYPSESGWAQLREAQRLVTTKLPNTALVVGLGLGEWNDIHPLNKKELAKRVALQADRLAYNQEKNVSSGPVCISAKLEDGKIALTFQKGTDDFLPVDSLEGFAIADKDGRYQWAKAQISGNKILIWNENIANPTMIRYAWDDNPKGNLRNKTGLPASPFQIKVE
jgi:sialate O-acetylesterase